MSSHQNWVEALNISPENLSSWSAQAPSGTPLLVYCLEQGFIAIDAYFAWAQKQYEVPVLDSRFFSEMYDPKNVKDAGAQGDWHPWQFPVEKWDNVTIVACVEVPEPEERGKFRYVLADPRAMRDAWDASNVSQQTAVKAMLKEDAPPPPPSDIEAPLGISVKPKAFTLNLGDAVMEAPAAHEPEAPAAPAASEPQSQVSLQLETSNLFQTDPAPPEPMTRSTVVTELRNTRRELSNEEQNAIKDLFQKVGTRFQRSMIMKVADMNARPVYWDDRMQVTAGDTTTSVHLENPTFLRIVAKTAMPYHGYLMDSQAHRDFFQALGYTELPACVTAIPIKSDGNLWGMMVAIGTEANQKMDSLNFAQETTDGLVTKLGSEWIKAA